MDCVQQPALCRAHHITGFPSIRVFHSGHDDITVHGMKDHEVPTMFSTCTNSMSKLLKIFDVCLICCWRHSAALKTLHRHLLALPSLQGVSSMRWASTPPLRTQ